MSWNTRPFTYGAASLALMLLIGSTGASAAIVGIRARVESSIREFLNGEPASFTADAAETQPDGELAASAVSQLDSVDLGGALIGVGQAFSDFSDPTLIDEPNPREFALEAACYSNAPAVSYQVGCEAAEHREVLFVRTARDGIPREIAFGLDGRAQVESEVFLSGAIILWATTSSAALEGIIADVAFVVDQEDSREELFFARAIVQGARAGPGATGPIRLDEIGLDDLADLGLDEDSSAALADLLESGALRIWIIPAQSHRYQYDVIAERQLVLTARLSIELRNATGGTGVAAVLGRPFQNLADFMEGALSGIDGAKLQQALNRAMVKVESPKRTPRGRLCGAVDTSTIVLALSLSFMSWTRTRNTMVG